MGLVFTTEIRFEYMLAVQESDLKQEKDFERGIFL